MTQKEIIGGTIQRIIGEDKIIDIDVIDIKRWSVTVETEFGAYKIAYAYRHRVVRVNQVPNVGGWLITIGY